MQIGLSEAELQAHIDEQMTRLDEAQEDAEHLGPYGELLRLAAQIAYQRAAEMIVLNNQRLSEQLAAAGVVAPPE
ncbi:MAG: hypothetical protein ACR2LS_00960 [Thermomicrobiales bacterium]